MKASDAVDFLGEGRCRFWRGVERLVEKRPFALEPVLFGGDVGGEMLVWPPARYRELKIWSPHSPDGGKSRPIGWAAFALRRRLWQAKAVCASPLPGKAGADVVGKVVWLRQRF